MLFIFVLLILWMFEAKISVTTGKVRGSVSAIFSISDSYVFQFSSNNSMNFKTWIEKSKTESFGFSLELRSERLTNRSMSVNWDLGVFLNINVPNSIDHFVSKANGDLEILVFSSFMSSWYSVNNDWINLKAFSSRLWHLHR